MRYRVYEEMNGSREIVLETDSLEEAKARYAKCWGAGRGAGGIWDNQTPKGGYGWIA